MTASKARTSTARAAASRRNGARSKGPRTRAGKARSAGNALRHGLAAQATILLPDEDAAGFETFARALRAELAPRGPLQNDLVSRIVVAAWRAKRADRLEAALLARHLDIDPDPQVALGAGLVRDGHGPRALETLLRYRGSVLAELYRALAALRALQAEAQAPIEAALVALPPPATTKRTRETGR